MNRGDRVRKIAVVGAALGLLAATPALAAFPGNPPSENPALYPTSQENPRVNTPNDPGFDNCEGDDEQGGPPCPEGYWDQQFGLFGFRPDAALNGVLPTSYQNCAQLDAQGKDANVKAGDPECSQISGVRADSAWKFSAGRPDVSVAILDTGIRWDSSELIDKVRLNRNELPQPNAGRVTPLRGGGVCATSHTVSGYDKNNDGAFNVVDYACHDGNGLGIASGDTRSDNVLDASDLIAAFSNNTDSDPGGGNGYEDDIAGWDFFDDDNDPYDASSCCNAGGHGTGRSNEAVRATNNGSGEAGLCPNCQFVPMRVWDTFVVDTNLYAMATMYAADNGIDVVEGAVGGLLNSNFARRAFKYADSKGVSLTLVSSDIDSANHNYPTHYNEAMYISGSLPDSAPGINCHFPGLSPIPESPPIPGCAEFRAFLLANGGITATTAPSTTSFFRNSNLTQYGGKNDVVLVGSTGSVNTGQASGVAGLLESYARTKFANSGFPAGLTGNETRQLLTMTAEDVLPENTGQIGSPDKANPGWDTHFGYGRVNMAGAMRKIQAGEIPPEVQIDSPDWFAPINVDRVGAGGIPIHGRIASPHFDDAVTWELEYACGQDTDSGFQRIASGEVPAGPGAEFDGKIGELSKGLLTSLAQNCNGSVANDAGRPAGNPNQAAVPWPVNPYPEPDPERHAFQLRLTAREKGRSTNMGRYRKTLHAYSDDGNLNGWPKAIGPREDADRLITGGGGETSPRLYDMNGDNKLDVILPTSSGEVHVLDAKGDPLSSWNGGQPVRTRPYAAADAHPALSGLDPPREVPRVPVIGDVTGDGEPEVLTTAGEHLYAWHEDGSPVANFPRRIDPTKSEPCLGGEAAKPCFDSAEHYFTEHRHLKRGFLGSPALADLNGDGKLDVVAGSLDQHLYAWKGDGDPLPGFPKRLDGGDTDNNGVDDEGAEIINSPAIAELDGDNTPEIVISTNEVSEAVQEPPGSFEPQNFLQLFAGAVGGNNYTYAVNGNNGSFAAGWPVETGVLAGDLLPLVLPGHDAAVGDLDTGRAGDEVAMGAGTGTYRLIAGDGTPIQSFTTQPEGSSGLQDKSLQLSIADYPSIGRLTDALGPSVIKGGISAGLAANLIAVNQNLPFNHAVQAWDPSSGNYRPGWPVATDDFQLLSQPLIGKVGGTGRQALVGTGMYQLHAYGEAGQEPAGWPKFTGGWTQPTPAMGDVDGDGKLDVLALTREGWAFLWKTEVDSCTAEGTTTNNEWWTFHHDEHGTANYGHDARPPSAPTDLAANRSGSQLTLTWKAPGDDLRCGKASRYRVLVSDDKIDGPQDGEVLSEEFDAAQSAGGTENRTVTLPTRAQSHGDLHVAVIYKDEKGNWGQPNHSELSALPAGPGPGSGGGSGGGGGTAPGRGPGGAPGSGGPGGRAGTRCLSRRHRVTRSRIGPARIGGSIRALQSRYAVVRRGRRALRFCVAGGGRFLVASRRGRITLVATTARRHGTTRTKPGRRIRRLRGRRRVARGVFAGRRGKTRVVYGLRRGRVRYLAVVSRGQLKKPRALARRLRALGLR